MISSSHVERSRHPHTGDSPIFVVGTARSGTTLTYSLLLSSGCFPIYEAESRILECASRYGALRSRRNRRRFLDDFLRSRQFSRSGLSELEVRRLAEVRTGSYLDFLDGFMGSICRAQGKSRWVEKSPNNTNFVEALGAYYPGARFIHVVRDGRSVTASQRKLGWGAKYARDPRRQLIWIANVWDKQVSSARRAQRFGDRYLEIRYEDLVTDLPGMLGRLGEFAGVDLEVSAVNASKVGALGGSNTAFAMDPGGVSKSALDRWRGNLEPEEIALLNWQIGRRLRQLGYQVDGNNSLPPVRDRWVARTSRLALDLKHGLNLHTPLGRVARRPLEIGLT